MILRRNGKYVVTNEKGDRKFGTYTNLKDAKRRLAQIHYFKHLGEEKGQDNNMDINSLLTYLKEELKDIPAKPDNIHYTNLYGLYNILQGGLKGQKGGYRIKAPKTRNIDMELSTVRNTHKLTDTEKGSLSEGAMGGIKIELFTDRILAAHRGTRKSPIAELPIDRQEEIKGEEDRFKSRYGFMPPKLFKFNEKNFSLTAKPFTDDRENDEELIKGWLKRNNINPSFDMVDKIYWYNRNLFHYYEELVKREREERFILTKNIPANPDFMRITIERSVIDFDEDGSLEFIEDDNCHDRFLKLIDSHEKLFVKNDEYYDFRQYLMTGEVR